jgi:uncharacterized protein
MNGSLASPESPPELRRFPFWGYSDLLLFFGLAVAAVVLMIIGLRVVLTVLPGWRPTEELIALPAQLILYVLLYGVLWLIIRIKYGQPVWQSLGWSRSRIPGWQAIVGGCVLSLLVGFLGTALHTPQVHSPFEKFLQTPVWMAIFGVFAVFIGPLAEEVIFRGFLQPLLSRDLGIAAGISITALVFGLLHGPEYSGAWQYILLIAFAGACFGWVRFRAQSIIPAALMHAGFNAVFFFAAIAQSSLKK